MNSERFVASWPSEKRKPFNINEFKYLILPVILHNVKQFNNFLDVGCQGGRLFDIVSPYFENSIGIDVVPKRDEFIECDILEYETDIKFDFILVWAVLYSVRNKLGALKKCKNFLNDGGIIVVADNKSRHIPGHSTLLETSQYYDLDSMLKDSGLNQFGELLTETENRVTFLKSK